MPFAPRRNPIPLMAATAGALLALCIGMAAGTEEVLSDTDDGVAPAALRVGPVEDDDGVVGGGDRPEDRPQREAGNGDRSDHREQDCLGAAGHRRGPRVLPRFSATPWL